MKRLRYAHREKVPSTFQQLIVHCDSSVIVREKTIFRCEENDSVAWIYFSVLL